MNDSGRRLKHWASCMGAGVLVFCLSLSVTLEGGSPTNSNGGRTFSAAPGGADSVGIADGLTVYRSGRISRSGEFPLAAPIVVDYRDDVPSRLREEGQLTGPWRPNALQRNGVAGGACSFDIDCDDCNPCTNDRCLINAGDPFGSGTCSHEFIADGGGSSACSDGLFCNGIETCQGTDGLTVSGVCELPGSGTGVPIDPDDSIPCSGACRGGIDHGNVCTVDGDCRDGVCGVPICDENQNTCDTPCTVQTCGSGSDNPGAVCTVDADCPNGTCQTPDQMCDNGIQCDGVEVCDITTGVCTPGVNPCGPGGRCGERSCAPGAGPNGPLRCTTDGDCGTGRTCLTPAEPGYEGPSCGIGRCCTPDVDPTEFLCSKEINANCQAAGQAWSPSATLFSQPQALCGQCPKYSGGISPLDTPTVIVGAVSNSTCGGIIDLGDDYTFSNGSFISIEELVFVGGVRTVAEGRMSVEFYDAAGGFIEDTFFASGSGIAVRTLQFDPPITLPPNGFVVWRVAGAFSPNGEIFIGATDVAEIGTNDAALIWQNGAATPNWLEVCSGGTQDGLWCNPANTDCVDGGGTCGPIPNVLAYELTGTKTMDPSGACCDMTGGTCTPNLLPWVCEAAGGVARGIGQFCAVCSNDSLNLGGDCFANGNADCQFCNGGANDFLPCAVPTDCPGGTCQGTCIQPCLVGACCDAATGSCTDGLTEAACTAAAGNFVGFGTDCEPDCCPQPVPTGADECALTTPIMINVPQSGICQGGANNGLSCTHAGQCGGELCSRTISVTTTGNNISATGPDSCSAVQFDPVASDVENVDPGWWESFSIDDCAFVRMDMCCSEPLHAPQWVVMWNACPCQDGQGFVNSVNPNEPTLPANNRGAPFCDGDNLWWQYGPLRAGTYYQPILSSLAGAHGPYQLHITADACPDAACCHSQCSETGVVACTTSAECGIGETCLNGFCILPCQVDGDCVGTCNPICDLTNVLECGDIGGNFLAPPFRDTGVTFCDNTPGSGTCETGSCCRGPGECEDSTAPDSFIPITKGDCDGVGGTYVGGLFCAGGVCVGAGALTDQSCSSDADCGGALGACQPRPGQDVTQPSPCPLCDVLDNAHCFLQTGFGFISDNCVGDCDVNPDNGHDYVAEDFVADESGDITIGCVAGSWLDQASTNPQLQEGSDDRTPERLFVTIYNDNNGVPGAAVAPRQRVTIIAAGIEFFNGSRAVWRYQWSLPTPVPVLQGRTYWIEAFMDSDGLADDGTPAGRSDVDWFWSGADPLDTRGPQGNDYSMLNTGTVYDIRDVNPGADHAFCLNIAMSVPPEPVRPCCICPSGGGAASAGGVAGGDPACRDSIGADECINDLQGDWRFEVNECLGFTCPNTAGPANDLCLDSITIGNGSVAWNNLCATDSPAPIDQIACGGVDTTSFTRDLWYTYIATETADWSFSLCDKEGEFDTVLALYSNGTGTCPCPSDSSTQLGDCSDDGCVFTASGSEIIRPVTAGTCYLIRIGGFAGAQGRGLLTVGPDAAVIVTPPPADDTTGAGGHGQRYLEIAATNSTGLEVIRVKPLVTPDLTGGASVLYLGVPFSAPDGDLGDPARTFTASLLGCEPVAADFGAFTSIAVYGAEIIPSTKTEVAQYSVQRALATCANLTTNENCWSQPPLIVSQGLFGDVASPFFSAQAQIQPDLRDIGAYVSKFLAQAGSLSKPSAQLVKNIARPFVDVNLLDISNTVGGFLGSVTYATARDTTGFCTCPSAVTCGATACTGDAQCPGGLCDLHGAAAGGAGFCVDGCGRCAP